MEASAVVLRELPRLQDSPHVPRPPHSQRTPVTRPERKGRRALARERRAHGSTCRCHPSMRFVWLREMQFACTDPVTATRRSPCRQRAIRDLAQAGNLHCGLDQVVVAVEVGATAAAAAACKVAIRAAAMERARLAAVVSCAGAFSTELL